MSSPAEDTVPQVEEPVEEVKEKEGEMDAAAALTSLVGAEDPADEEAEEGEDEDFVIPQRFTRSGRRRATPFPVKVRLVERL